MKITISIQLFAMQCIQVVRKYQKLDPLQTNLKNITWKNSGKYNGEDPCNQGFIFELLEIHSAEL